MSIEDYQKSYIILLIFNNQGIVGLKNLQVL